MMNQALIDQAGLNRDISDLLWEQDEEAMMNMDQALGPTDDPKLFKDLPNFNQSSTMEARRRRFKRKKHKGKVNELVLILRLSKRRIRHCQLNLMNSCNQPICNT
jgi:hypothetical protein